MGKRFDVIEAKNEDLDWVRELAVQASIHTLGGPRSAPSACADFIEDEFPELIQFVREGSFRFLIAIDREKDETRIGYLMLNLFDVDALGRRQTCVEDFAVVPSYAGHNIGILLFEAAATLTGELGVDFMAGECQADNRLINTADRYNCVLESYSFFRACTPEAERIMEEAKKERDDRRSMALRLLKIRARRRKRKRG